MIPVLALMFALYATARLANDLGRFYPENDARRVAWIISVFVFTGLWFLAMYVTYIGATAQH